MSRCITPCIPRPYTTEPVRHLAMALQLQCGPSRLARWHGLAARSMPPRAWDHVLSQGSAAGDSPALHRLTVQKRAGGEGTRLWVDDLEGLLAWSRSAPSSCILEFHGR